MVISMTYIPVVDNVDKVDGFHSGQLLFGVRQEVLDLFEDPKVLINTCSMNYVRKSADKAEASAGNISSNSKELTIIGGTASTKDNSWVYWNLPTDASRVYTKVHMLVVSNGYTTIDYCDADGSTYDNPPNTYLVWLQPQNATKDFGMQKRLSGTNYDLGSEGIDLSANTYYLVEYYWDDSGKLKVWRDNVLKFDITDTAISPIRSVRFRMRDNSTSEALKGKFKGPVIIIYE